MEAVTVFQLQPLMGLARSDLVEPGEDENIENCAGVFWDDIRNVELPPELARKARREELQVLNERDVWEVFPRSSMKKGSKLVGIRWVETDKGTPAAPKVRSRFVCREFARGQTPDDMFALTPPLVATRWLLSELASRRAHGPGDHRLMIFDFKRAFLYGECERDLYVELPEEDENQQGGANMGK